MCIEVFCRKVEIEVKGPKEYKLLIVKSSIPGRYAKKPRVFWGGDNKIMRASFSDSASSMSYAMIATVHDGNGQVLKTFNLPNSFLPYKRLVFHLEEPYRFHGIPITGWLEDLLRFFVRRNKSQEPDYIPTVPKSTTPPFPDLVPVATYFGPVSDICFNYLQYLTIMICLFQCLESPPLDGIRDYKVAQWNDNGSRSCEMNGGHLLLNTDDSHQSSSDGSYTCDINGDHLLLKTDDTDQSSLNGSCSCELNGNHLLLETDDTDQSSPQIEILSPQMSPISVSDTAVLPKSLSQRTDESCERGSSSNHTPYHDADTSPFNDSFSPNSSHVNMGSRYLSEILGNTWKELKGIMDLQAG